MASLLSKPKQPDSSRQQALLAEQEKKMTAQELETKRKQAASLKARNSGKKSSLITGSETGVLKTTLG